MATTYTQRSYTESDGVKKLREQMEAQAAARPADYTSKWQPQIDATMDSILNRKDFQYDVNGDALYQQYKDRYVNLGQQAMMDTMGQAAKLTGGYGNSYAQMAGQQAYQGYLQGLTDKIPELASLAQQRYAQQGQDLYNRYGLLSGQDQADYSRWQNMYNQWLSDRDWAAGRFDTERGYDYGQHRDSVGDDQWKAQFDEDIRRFDFANQLGEFAPVASAGGGGGYYYDGNGGNGEYQKIASDLNDPQYVTGNYVTDIKGDMASIRAAVADGKITTNQARDLVSKYISTKR